MAVVKWTFHDPLTDELYTFDINANAGGSPTLLKKMNYQATSAPDGAAIIFEGQDEVPQASFSGTILTRPQYDAMVTWFNKRHVIEFTDDLGRLFQIYVTSFEPARVRSAMHPWKHTYSVKYIVLATTEP